MSGLESSAGGTARGEGQEQPTHRPTTSEERSHSVAKRYILWDTFLAYVCRLIDKIESHGDFKGCTIVAPPRNGSIIGGIVAHALETRDFHTPCEYDDRVRDEGCKLLVIDDLVDSGQTLEHWYYRPDAVTAVIFRKPWSTIVPDIWVEETEEWIVFPWEKLP